MATLEQLNTWLTEAETTRHQIATGSHITEYWKEGRRITRTRVSLTEINEYIASLQAQIDAHPDNTATTAPRRRALSVQFR